MADKALLRPPVSIIDKTSFPQNIQTGARTNDKRYYFSSPPYYWDSADLPTDVLNLLKHNKTLTPEKLSTLADAPIKAWDLYLYYKFGLLHLDGKRAPGTVVGSANSNKFDRESAWNLVDNVTTLALAWHFTDDMRYAQQGARYVEKYILDDLTGMHPSLMFAQRGNVK